MSKQDGGNAFPTGDGVFGGMSLRDYFAGQALASAHQELARQMGEGELAGFGWDMVARDAYRIADAMLEARTK